MNSIREIALQRCWLCQGVGAGRLARGRAARAAHPRCCHSASPLSLPVHHSMRSTRTRMCTAHTARAHVPWHCCSYLTCCFLSAAQVARSSGSLRTGATRRALGCSRPSHGGMLRTFCSWLAMGELGGCCQFACSRGCYIHAMHCASARFSRRRCARVSSCFLQHCCSPACHLLSQRAV